MLGARAMLGRALLALALLTGPLHAQVQVSPTLLVKQQAAAPGLDVSQLFAAKTHTDAPASVSTGFQPDLVWIKSRSTTAVHAIFDSARGTDRYLSSDSTNLSANLTGSVALTATGFTLGSQATVNQPGWLFASWSWKQDPRFLKVIAYTGDGVAGRTVNPGLSPSVSVGMVITKRVTGAASNWVVWNRGFSAGSYAILNSSAAQTTTSAPAVYGNGTSAVVPTPSAVTLGTSAMVNAAGSDYIMYVFAHDTAPDGVIQCGSTTGAITLPWTAQWGMAKATTTSTGWRILDTARGWGAGNDAVLLADDIAVEATGADFGTPSAPTNFTNPTAWCAIRAP